jgi:hypothetical protein
VRPPLQCRICKKTFQRQTQLRQHDRTHHPVAPHMCQNCGIVCIIFCVLAVTVVFNLQSHSQWENLFHWILHMLTKSVKKKVQDKCPLYSNTVKPLSIISEGTAKNKRWIQENDSCRKVYNVSYVRKQKKKNWKISFFLLMPAEVINKGWFKIPLSKSLFFLRNLLFSVVWFKHVSDERAPVLSSEYSVHHRRQCCAHKGMT